MNKKSTLILVLFKTYYHIVYLQFVHAFQKEKEEEDYYIKTKIIRLAKETIYIFLNLIVEYNNSLLQIGKTNTYRYLCMCTFIYLAAPFI